MVADLAEDQGFGLRYHVRRALLFLWSWEVVHGEQVVRSGLALNLTDARWAARSVIRAMRRHPE